MFRTPTTIVVGAGASKDYRLPLGSELREEISELINIGFDDFGHSLETGDSNIVAALRVVAQKRSTGSINPFIPPARQMAVAMPMALSIDNYMDAHQHDEEVLICRKLAISRAILNAERGSTLSFDPRYEKNFDLAGLQGTWMARLVNVLTEDVPKAGIESIFDNLTIVSSTMTVA